MFEQGLAKAPEHEEEYPIDDIDEQRLLAYKEEEKSWNWIFRP
jgi:hypothetical protein